MHRNLRRLTTSTALAALLVAGTAAPALAEDPPLPPPDSIYVETIGADALHAAGHDGSGVGIAVVDTGITEVADLAGRVTAGVDLSGEGTTDDAMGHGTFIAGIAAGDGTASGGEHAGVAPGAHVVPVRIAGADGAADVSHVLAALQWVVSHRDTHDIDVVNLSFSTPSLNPTSTDLLNLAVQRVWDAGIVVVVAAGNNGDDPMAVGKPADDPLVITVGSTDNNLTVDRSDDTVSSFSSRGPTFEGLAKPDLVGPGRSLVGLRVPGSTIDEAFPASRVDDHYARASGTSFTAGVVSGAAALLLDANPTWTPDEVKHALLTSAAPGPVGDPLVDGHGALDVAAAAIVDPAGASQDAVTRSRGTASLSSSRGGLEVRIGLDLGWTVLDVLLDRLGAFRNWTAQARPFDATDFRDGPWTVSTWLGSQWQGSKWQGSQWQGSQWQGSQWQGSQWQGSQWQGSQWHGVEWQGAWDELRVPVPAVRPHGTSGVAGTWGSQWQ